MVSNLKYLFLFTFVVHWSTGYGFFLGNRRDSSSSTGSDNSAVQSHNVDAVTHWHRPQSPIPVQAEALLAVNDYIPPSAATIPLPIAIQLPQQILPLAMYPAIQAPFPSYKSNHRAGTHHNNVNAIPFVKFSPSAEHPTSVPNVGAAHPSTMATVRFLPCFCGNNYNEEKRGYGKSSVPYAATPMGYQPFQLLPCYCPVVHDAEPQYVQSSPISSSTAEPQVRDYSVSTVSPK